MPGCTPTTDSNGQMTYDCAHHYTWDAEGKTYSVDSTILTHDALGRMVEMYNGSSYTEFVFGPTGGRFATMHGQTLVHAFVALPGGGTAVYNSSGIAYYRHADHLGSSRLATTPSRTLYSSTAYSPYGELYAQAGNSDVSFTGIGQDLKTGLYDFQDRENSSAQGRWLSPDPAGLGAVNMANPQSWNRYAYVMNNPMALIDPLGDEAYEGCSPTATPWCYYSGNNFILSGEWSDPFAFIGIPVTQCNFPCTIGTTFPIPESVPLPAGAIGATITFQDPALFTIGDAFLVLSMIDSGQAANNSINQNICNSLPNGRVIGISGGAGGLGATVSGGELVLNYDTGQISAFGFGGFQGGWNGVLSATAYTGMAWGLNGNNSNYSGGFTGFSAGTNVGIFADRSSGGLTNGPGGLLPSSGPGTVTVVGATVSATLFGKVSLGLNATNYTNPVQLGKFWAFTQSDWINYFERSVCR